ncbi:(2Fe-2S)-binding protein [Spirochaetia bacterium]|nr:(2Fe-2S)-binding protein [Spirochaetia bacterium]
MTISFTLNGSQVTISPDGESRLSDIIRSKFLLTGTRQSCLSGICGCCLVFFNGDIVKSCLIPAFRLDGAEVSTIEHFSHTDNYADIIEGFSRAGVENCGFCDSGKILATESLLKKNPVPDRGEILVHFTGIRCRCTEPDSLVAGVLNAAEIRQRRRQNIESTTHP